MFDRWRAYWLKQTFGTRETFRLLYRHYRLERERIEARRRPSADTRLLSAIVRAQEQQRHGDIEREVRRFHEMSRFVSRDTDPAA